MKHVKLFEQFIGEASYNNLQGPILTFKGQSGLAQLYRESTLLVIQDESGNEIARVVSAADKARRPDIKELQSKLEAAGYNSTPIEGSWEHTYTEQQVHKDKGRGFFGNIEKIMGSDKADEMFRETMTELKKNYGATEYGALNLLNSHYGSIAAKHIIEGNAETGIGGLLFEWENEPVALKKWVKRANTGYFNYAGY